MPGAVDRSGPGSGPLGDVGRTGDLAQSRATPGGRAAPAGQPAPPTPDAARAVFGDRCALAERYVAELADTGISHGLIGPREAPVLWSRHVLNCAVIHPAFAPGAHVADIGTGAGLPGVCLAIARPDLQVELIEPLARRTRWLDRVVTELALPNVRVHTARAEALAGDVSVNAVTARAVKRLAQLTLWAGPLLRTGGVLVAMKGAGAEREADEDRAAVRRHGGIVGPVQCFGEGVVDPPTRVLRVQFPDGPAMSRSPGRSVRSGRRGRSGRRSGEPGRTG